MKSGVFILTLAILLGGAIGAYADVIELKSGEVIEGKITLTSGTQVVIEVQVSSSIKEERVVEKADIARMDQKKPDEEAFLVIKDIGSPATVASAQEYADLINGQLKPFLKKFPNSPHAPDVRKMVEVLEADRARVEGGELRVDGRWISREEYIGNLFYYDAFFRLRDLQALTDKGDLPGALNAYFEFEKEYSKTAAYPDAVLLTLRNLQRFEKAASAYLQRIPAILEQREKGLALSSEDAKVRIRNAVEQERIREATAIKQAKDAKMRYYPLYPENEAALKELRQMALDDLQKLGALKVTQWKRSVDLTREALRYAEKGEIRAAESALKQAEVFWPESDFLKSTKEKIGERKAALERSSQAQAKAIEDAALAATPSPTPAPQK